MLHVAINALFWNHPATGSGQYIRQLVRHMRRLISDLQITLIAPQFPGAAGLTDVPAGVAVTNVPARAGQLGKVLFEQRGFPRACRAVGADVAHVPYWGSPLQTPVPTVVTVHDLTTLLVREYRRRPAARLYTALVSASARGAAHVITDSKASRQDIMHRLAIPAARVTPIYLAVDERFSAEENLIMDMAILKKYDLPDFYVLYLGGYALHKNIETLIHAYTYVARALGKEYPLVLAGRKPATASDAFPDYDQLIERLRLEEHVRWIGLVDEEDKPAVYRNASSFVFPSRHEGFGLPPLEAMACGVPVVTTATSSLPEVVGDAAFAVDPDDERALAGAIIATVIQDNLAAELRVKGAAQVSNFSWARTATQTALIYDQVRRP